MRVLKSTVLLLIGLLVATPAYAIDIAGTVERLLGSAMAIGANGFSRPLQQGSSILVGDRLATTSGSRMRLRMRDGATITLGGNSSMTVEAYDDSEDVGQAVLGLAEGAFSAASGAIAKLGPDRFTVTTPIATLGVRGTEVWAEQLPGRLEITLFTAGSVVVTTPEGSVELTEAGAGIAVLPGGAPPPPKFWNAEHMEYARRSVGFD